MKREEERVKLEESLKERNFVVRKNRPFVYDARVNNCTCVIEKKTTGSLYP